MEINKSTKLVIIESPYAGEDIKENICYARAAVRDSLLRGEAPIASHLLYTQDGILDDTIESERRHGILAGLAWGRVSDKSVIYIDKGISKGMQYGIDRAISEGRELEFRSLKEFETEDGLTVEYCKQKYFTKTKFVSPY